MSRIGLRHLLGRQKDASAIVASLASLAGGSVAVEDAEGRVVHGDAAAASGARFPVLYEGTPLGWVSGGAGAEVIASLLSHLTAREAERKTLGSEVLHLYREVNLIYNFSEQLAARLDLGTIAELTLAQARHLLAATDGAVLRLEEDQQILAPIARFGDAVPHPGDASGSCGIVASIVATGQAEIINDVRADPRCAGETWSSLLCAPLKIGERVTGVIALASTEPVAYTAADLKLLNTLALQTATAFENARLFERTVQAARERERLLALHKELELAARIQADLFPASLPDVPGYDIAARNRSARQCGGDYYDVLPVPGGAQPGVLFCVADVSGKGLPASLLMSNMQATLRALLGHIVSLPVLAAEANDLLHATTPANKYVTAALLELAPATGEARYVSAGHTDCLHLGADGEEHWLKSTGTPLGLMAGLPYQQTAMRLQPGDIIALFSDGVPEAQTESGDEFGEARLAAVVRDAAAESASAIVSRVFDAVDAFAGGAPQYDDVTVLIVKRT